MAIKDNVKLLLLIFKGGQQNYKNHQHSANNIELKFY